MVQDKYLNQVIFLSDMSHFIVGQLRTKETPKYNKS